MRPRFGVLGGGYVGLTVAVEWAERGYNVVLIESSAVRFDKLMEGSFLSSEQELIESFRKVREQEILEITQDLSALSNMDYVLVCLEVELASLWTTIEQIASFLPEHAGLIIKSTVSVGTADQIQTWFDQKNQCIEVISYPDFSVEGKTMEDIPNTSRIVLGGDADHQRLTMLRRLLAKHQSPILVTTRKNAEMIKYAANVFLATKISFINQISQLCEGFGLDVQSIARGIGMDPRIGQAFLEAGLGFGGTCLPKDLSSLIFQAQEHQIEVPLLEAVRKVNQKQEEWALTKLTEMVGTLEGKRIAVWGVTFKERTEDIHHSIALSVIEQIHSQGAELQIYDPYGKNAFAFYGKLCYNSLETVEQADVLLILTDWQEFKEVDLFEIKKRLRFPLVIDGRNLYPPAMMKELGFEYVSVGRKV